MDNTLKMDNIFKSRFFKLDDPILADFQWEDINFKIKEKKWWSRVYEYRWLQDCCTRFFIDIKTKNVIDIATGEQHPGLFILSKIGFKNVIGTDIFDIGQYWFRHKLQCSRNYIQEDILQPIIKDKFDCVVAISFLEHLPPESQKLALINMIERVENHGCIILTFDYPFYDYATNLDLYKSILKDRGFYFECENICEKQIMNSANSDCSNEYCKKMSLSCYRIFATKNGDKYHE